MIPEHLDEWLAAGVFFVALTLAEVAAAAAVLAWDRAWRLPALVAAVVVSAGPLLVWLVSRTVGLPFGPEAFEPEAVGVADVLSCVLELTDPDDRGDPAPTAADPPHLGPRTGWRSRSPPSWPRP